MTIKELEKEIGATTLGYLSIEGAVNAVGKPISHFCLACFNGDYPVPVPNELKKHAFDDPPETGEIATLTHGQFKLIEA